MLLETPICNFGWQAPDFTLNDPNGEAYMLQSLMGDKGLLIMFICNHCPYVIKVAPQLAQDSKTLIAQGINVVAIMTNDYRNYPDDAPAKMLEFKAQYGFEFPYLVDETQAVAKSYDAVCTPDFFGFNQKGELQYRGRADELLAGMQMVAQTGNGPEEQTPSMGCSIKWR